MKENNRVVFYSKEDRSAGHNLSRAEKRLNETNLNDEFDINDLLEFYHIKLYFDNEIFLLNWNENDKSRYKETTNKVWELTRKFWIKICNENIIDYIQSLEYRYKESFWDLIEYFQVYKKIESDKFVSILDKFKRQIIYILPSKNIVAQFDKQIKEFLIDYSNTAELLLAKIEEKHRFKTPNYYFPKSLTLSDREKIISKYLDSEDANLNYVRLIVKSKDSIDLKLSPKLRLKAKKKADELNNQILEDGYTWQEGIEVAISKDQDEPVKYSRKEHIIEVCYSKKYLDRQSNELELFEIFSKLFAYTDSDGLITLVSKENELEVLERTLMQSKNEYSTGSVFSRKSGLSQMQLLIFEHYLNQRNTSIEKVIAGFLDIFLKPHFNINNLRFKFPSKDSTNLEKIRILAPEFDSLLKQYQIFINEGFIDFELFELDSTPLRFSEVSSLVERKYVYIKSDQILFLKHKFFSDQSMLYYIEPFKDKYLNLYDLLLNENVTLENFENYQKDEINKLIEEEYLCIDSNNHVKINKGVFLLLVRDLNRNEVLSYWHYPDFIRNVIDEMLDENLLYSENILLTKQEQKFFNFYLNKKEFTNGLDLRNKYLHGTNPNSEDEQENDYNILLKLLILILLKIEDDLLIKKYLT